MKSIITGCVLAASLVAPASAAAHDEGTIEHKNSYLRAKAVKVTGDKAAPGRDIVRDGTSDGEKASLPEIRSYFDTLRRMIEPPAPAPAAPAVTQVATAVPTSASATSSSSSSTSTSSSGYALPAGIVQCESGGDYGAVNTTNPNRPAGAYQIITSTWRAWGGTKYAPTADQATPAQQDEIAANGWNGGAGAGHWECKG